MIQAFQKQFNYNFSCKNIIQNVQINKRLIPKHFDQFWPASGETAVQAYETAVSALTPS